MENAATFPFPALCIEAQGCFLSGRLGFGFAVVRVSSLREAHANRLRYTEFFHGHPIHHIGASHGAFGVGDDDELGAIDEAIENLDETVDIGLVERGVELVKDAERGGFDHVDREQESDGGHRAFTT